MTTHAARARPLSALAPAAALAIIVALAVLAPAIVVLAETPGTLARAVRADPWPSLSLTLRSVAVALGIATLTTLFAIPAALMLAMARRPALWGALALSPAVLPPYLASAAWGLSRAPGTTIGDALLRAASDGAHWAPVLAARATAAFALAIWSWPLAALILAAVLRETDADALDAARLEHRPRRAAAALFTPRLLRGGSAAVGVLTVLMLGSAVPLHVAQFETLSLRAWTMLTLLPPGEHAAAWLAAWPVLLAAAVAAVLAARAATSPSARRAHAEDRARRAVLRTRLTPALALVIWTLAVVVPLVLLALALERPGSVLRVLQLDRDAWIASAARSLAPGALAVVITLTVWHALAAGGPLARRLATLAATLLAFAALAPGVLIAAAVARLAAHLPFDAHHIALPLAHTARFGFVAALVGCALAAAEPVWRRDLRFADGARSLPALLAAAGPFALAAPLAAGLLVALLAFHEIEAAVILTPPGSGNLARILLDRLHFARMEDLSAACLVLAAAAFLVAPLAIPVALLAGHPRAQGPRTRA